MENFLYTMFVALDAWVTGAAGFGAVLLLRLALLSKGRERRKRYYMSLAKAGYAATSAVLLYAITALGSIEANPRTWAYLAGLIIAGVGFTGVAGIARDELAERETKES